MLPRFIRLTGLTLLTGLLATPAAHASTHVFVQFGVPAPVVAAPPVYVAPAAPAYVWRPGYYVRTPFGPRWVPGRWVPRVSYRRGWEHERWEHERWDRGRRGYDRDWRDYDRDRFHDRDRRDWR